MYVNLVETYEEAADIKTKKVYKVTKVLEQEEATDKTIARLHKKRLKLLTKGKDVQVIRTAVRWDDPRREVSRTRRRAMQGIMRKIMKNVQIPRADEQQVQVDREVDKVFEQKAKRRKSGLVVPEGHRGGHR
ncbi:hypothetical protein LCGC14_1855970 [marine sediment metagenome]|uniref:Uncharacterized protein n=1 Tax=marine sediment metagenome TaxID=412755 RepID=A0A0F9G8X0_9ZZZZ